jgi:putative addiction module component (TIGR02574 family)
MIEQLPEVQKLTPKQKFQLASELWDEISEQDDAAEPDPAIVELLEQRHAEYKSGRQPSSSWEDVKRRLGKL